VGSVGYTVLGAADYRLNNRTTLGAGYTYLHFSYPSAYGNTHANGVFLRGARRMRRNINASLTVGVHRLTATGTETVQLSPEVAAILGITRGVAAYRRESWLPLIQAGMSYDFERSRFSAMYATGISPGNGVYQTSQSEAVSVGYSFAGTRKLSFGASARYSKLGSRSLTIGQMESSSAGGGINYVLTQVLNLSSQLDYRTFESPGVQGREGLALTFGITLSPSRFPLSIW